MLGEGKQDDGAAYLTLAWPAKGDRNLFVLMCGIFYVFIDFDTPWHRLELFISSIYFHISLYLNLCTSAYTLEKDVHCSNMNMQ